MRFIVLLCLGLSQIAMSKTLFVEAGDNFEVRLQAAIADALPGDTVELAEGRFSLKNEITIESDLITLKGQGKDKTTIYFENDQGGPQAVYVTGDQVVIEDLAIEDHPGDGLKTYGVNGLTIRNVKVEWTVKGRAENGSYGFYPVMSENILIENTHVIGASDAGIYVGQSKNIIVRNNLAEYNVAGIEIENSSNADVYGNEVRYNTGGILVFDLPDLFIPSGKNTRIYNNHIYENNTENFASKAGSVAFVPAGSGILLLAAKNTEVFGNKIEKHNLNSITLASYHVMGLKTKDARFDHLVKGTYIHHNKMSKGGLKPYKSGSELGWLMMGLSLPHQVPDIVFDGIGEDSDGHVTRFNQNGRDKICIGYNESDKPMDKIFAHFDLSSEKWWKPYPGEFADFSREDFNCSHIKQVGVKFPFKLKKIDKKKAKTKNYCKKSGAGINWKALQNNDCELLSDYGLFKHSPEKSLDGYPYAVNTPLFTDYASKARNFYIPAGKKIKYQDRGEMELPRGSVITKTFYYKDHKNGSIENRLVETRLSIHRKDGWHQFSYEWKEGVARLAKGGAFKKIAFTDKHGEKRDFEYAIPNAGQCSSCHSDHKPIGLRAKMINRDAPQHFPFDGNQLEYYRDAGILEGFDKSPEESPRLAVWNDPSTGDLETRAKAYLDSNCRHCHSPYGKANYSGLFLNSEAKLATSLGLCKPPVAAGRGAGFSTYDIVPGDPDQSIIVERTSSNKSAIKMPEVGRNLVHKEGVALLREWINSLEGVCD